MAFGKRTGGGGSDGSQPRAESVFDAGSAIAKLLMDHYMTERGIHAETIIAAAAAITGEWALWQLDQPLPESGWVVGPGINEAIFEGQQNVWSIVKQAAPRVGLSEADLPDPVVVVARTAEAMGSAPYPPLSVPRENFPQEWSPVAGVRFRADVRRIGAEHGLDTDATFVACAICTAMLIEMTAEALDPRIGFRLALETMLGVAKMAPLASEEPYTSPAA